LIRLALPERPKRLPFKVSKTVLCIFIETARYHQPVPGDYTGVPEFPAMVREGVFDVPTAVGLLAVTGVPILGSFLRTALKK
jgi:hypothetical protein